MFRITEDPSSGSLVQYLAKITKNGSIVSVNTHTHTRTHIGLQYAAIKPTTSISTDTIEPFL